MAHVVQVWGVIEFGRVGWIHGWWSCWNWWWLAGWGQGGGKIVSIMVWWLISVISELVAVFVRVLDDF